MIARARRTTRGESLWICGVGARAASDPGGGTSVVNGTAGTVAVLSAIRTATS